MEPNQIAQLVMGYLKEKCLDAAAIFAATSFHLLQYRIQTFRNENPTTKVFNTTLNNILTEYKVVFTYIKNKFCEIKGSQLKFDPEHLIKHLETMINLGETDSDEKDKTTFYDSKTSEAGTAENIDKEDETSKDARLVLGYLQNECPDAAACFAATSSQLSSYRLQVFQKKDSSTTLNGMTLVDILQQYCAIRTCIQNELQVVCGSSTVCSPGDFIKNLEIIFNKTQMKTANNQRKRRRQLAKDDNIKREKLKIPLNLTKEQESRLNKVFQTITYVRGSQRQELAKELGIQEIQIQQWFQRKRNDEKDRLEIRNISHQNSADSSAS